MKTLIFLKVVMLAIFITNTVYSQSDFNITKQSLSNDLLLVKIEHQNGKYAEFLIEGHEDDFEICIPGFPLLNEPETESMPDGFKKNIKLPSDDYSSSPIQFFDAGSKIYCFGTKEVLIINSETGHITGTIPLSNSGSFSASSYLNHVPVNKFISGSVTNEKLYVADLVNNLYFIDAAEDTILLSHSYTDFSDQLSTSLVYHENLDLVYWMINSWQGTNGTVINVYDGSTGAYITQRLFNQQINDIIIANDTIFVSTGNDIIKLNPQNLNTISSYSGNPQVIHEKIFCLNRDEIAVVRYHYQSASRSIVRLNVTNLVPLQGIYPTYGSINIYDLSVETQYESFILLVLGDGGISDVYRYKINQDRLYVENNHLETADVFFRRLSKIINNTIFCGGRDNLFGIDLQNFEINNDGNIKGCYSFDILATSHNSYDYIYSANPTEGTISRHHADCSIDTVMQTAFKVNTGCLNTFENKLYFVNSRINYEESGLAIIDASTDELITTLKLGKYLYDAVYNETSNKVFVAGTGESKIFVVCGVDDELVHTISLSNPPTRLFSYQNKVLCATNSAIYVVDVATYNYTTLNLPFGASSDDTCRNFEIAEDFNSIYAMYTHSIYTYVFEIETTTFTIAQTHQLNFRKGEVIKYNPTDQRIYIVNSLLPKLYVYAPDDFSEINAVPFVGQAMFYDLNLSIDHYRNKAYLTYYNLAPQKHYLSIFDCEDYSYTTTELNTPKSIQAFNPINDQIYYYNSAVNQDNKNIMYSGILDCMDDANLPDVMLESLISRPYTFIRSNEQIRTIVDTKRNKVYLPGSDFSNVSVINAFTDILSLQNGWNWLSFPRMERYNNHPASSITVLERINYFPLELTLFGQVPNSYISYSNDDWIGNLYQVQSTEGYKLEFDVMEEPAPNISLHGARLHPDSEITLSPSQENWIGYFIQEAQWPWDAFPSSLYDNQLTSITAQYWAMFKLDGQWYASSNVRPINYGDMVIVTINGNEPVSFAWNNPEEAAEAEAALETEYYSFNEQAEYLPIFIEKGAEDDYFEVAVLANGVVKGAAVVLETDTLVQVRAYLGDMPPGTPLEFETWSGTKSVRAGSGSYAVKDLTSGVYEHRPIYKGENAPFHVVSLKPMHETLIPPSVSDVSCAPNPFGDNTYFNFRLCEETCLQIRVTDLFGKTLAIPVNGNYTTGYYSIAWDGTDINGKNIGSGIYIFRLATSKGQEVSGKIVLIK